MTLFVARGFAWRREEEKGKERKEGEKEAEARLRRPQTVAGFETEEIQVLFPYCV